VKGIEYLENCCKAKQYLMPQSAEILLPNGGIVVITPDIVLQEDELLPKTVHLLEQVKVDYYYQNHIIHCCL
jgi:hypothetical protein